MTKLSSFIIMLLLLSNGICNAQNETELKAQALKSAKETSQALLDLDYETIIKYTHPNIVEASGGKAKMVSLLETVMHKAKGMGVIIEKSEIGNLLNFTKEQGQYRCLIENSLVISMQTQKKRIRNKSSLFGFYDADIKQWYFVEAAKLNNAQVNSFFPDFKTSITIPVDEQSVEDF